MEQSCPQGEGVEIIADINLNLFFMGYNHVFKDKEFFPPPRTWLLLEAT
jgi:hypothetical protein